MKINPLKNQPVLTANRQSQVGTPSVQEKRFSKFAKVVAAVGATIVAGGCIALLRSQSGNNSSSLTGIIKSPVPQIPFIPRTQSRPINFGLPLSHTCLSVYKALVNRPYDNVVDDTDFIFNTEEPKCLDLLGELLEYSDNIESIKLDRSGYHLRGLSSVPEITGGSILRSFSNGLPNLRSLSMEGAVILENDLQAMKTICPNLKCLALTSTFHSSDQISRMGLTSHIPNITNHHSSQNFFYTSVADLLPNLTGYQQLRRLALYAFAITPEHLDQWSGNLIQVEELKIGVSNTFKNNNTFFLFLSRFPNLKKLEVEYILTQEQIRRLQKEFPKLQVISSIY